MTRNKPKLPMKMRFCHVNTLIIRTATFNSGNLRNWLVLLSEIFTLYSSCLAMAQDLSSNIYYKSTNDPKQTQLPMKIRFCHVNTLIIRTVVFNSGNLRNKLVLLSEKFKIQVVLLWRKTFPPKMCIHSSKDVPKTVLWEMFWIKKTRITLKTNYSVLSGKTMRAIVGNFWKGIMIRSGRNTKNSKMTAMKPTRKSSRGKGDFTATVGIAAQKCSIFVGIAARKCSIFVGIAARKCSIFVATSANVVVVQTPNRKDQKKKA